MSQNDSTDNSRDDFIERSDRKTVKGEVEDVDKFFRIMNSESPLSGSSNLSLGRGQRGRLNIDEENVKNGLAQLVMTLIKLLHELMERQAIRRIDSGSLTDEEIERLGLTLMKQSEEIERLRKVFNLDEEDLNIDLGPLGKLL